MKKRTVKSKKSREPTAEELEEAAEKEHFANYKLEKTPDQFENRDMLVHGPFDPEKNYFDYLSAEGLKATIEWHRKKRLLREAADEISSRPAETRAAVKSTRTPTMASDKSPKATRSSPPDQPDQKVQEAARKAALAMFEAFDPKKKPPVTSPKTNRTK